MDGAKLRDKVWRGFGIAARRTGFPYDVFRCRTPQFAADDDTKIKSSLPAFFTRQLPKGFVFTSPPDSYELHFHGLFDPTGLEVGDLLAGEQGSFFVMGITPGMPILTMMTTNVLTAYAATPAHSGQACGLGGYSAITGDNRAVAFDGWPCVLSLSTSGSRRSGGLPLAGGEAIYECHLPDLDLLHLSKGMVCRDDAGNSYVVEAVDTSPLGWRSILRLQVA